MGLITKVRGRVKFANKAGNGARTQLTYEQEQLFGLHLSQRERAHSTSHYGGFYTLLGCSKGRKPYYNYDCDFQKSPETMIMLFLLPLMMGRIGLLYACILYQYPIHRIWQWTKNWIMKGFQCVRRVGEKCYMRLDKCEMAFVNMNLYTMVNQMMFFMLCDRAIGLEKEQRVTSLYSLLFYNVLAYCFAYLKEVIEKENWDLQVNVTPSSKVRHLAMSTTKIVLEWIKAVTFIVTVVCMLLVLGLEQGLDHYRPTRFYILVTLLYYILTEKNIKDSTPNFLHFLLPSDLYHHEIIGLENLFASLLTKSLTALLNILILLLPLLSSPSSTLILPFSLTTVKVAVITMYMNVWLQFKSIRSLRNQIRDEMSVVSGFIPASKEELEEHDDVCAICLNPLDHARRTPCSHLFHTNCLRLCLKTESNLCPICKREFRFE